MVTQQHSPLALSFKPTRTQHNAQVIVDLLNLVHGTARCRDMLSKTRNPSPKAVVPALSTVLFTGYVSESCASE